MVVFRQFFFRRRSTDELFAGSLVCISPNWVVHNDPCHLQKALCSSLTLHRRPLVQGMKFDSRVDNLLSMTDKKQHAELRAKLMPGYTGQNMPFLESDIDGRVMDFIRLVLNYGLHRSVEDVHKKSSIPLIYPRM